MVFLDGETAVFRLSQYNGHRAASVMNLLFGVRGACAERVGIPPDGHQYVIDKSPFSVYFLVSWKQAKTGIQGLGMICSMTGYGAGESDLAGARTVVELRSVNGRFCDIAVRLPKSLNSLEGRLRAYVQDHVTRGNVSVSVRCDDGDNIAHGMRIDAEAGKKYCDALRLLRDELGISGDVTLEMVAAYPGLVTPEADEIDPTERWTGIQAALERALLAFKDMKRNEGKALESDLRGRIQAIQALLRSIEDRTPDRVAEFRKRLRHRIEGLLADAKVDPQRMAMEITLFAERSDVTEECVRLNAHCGAFLEALEDEGSPGRRLNFLIQEMNREINTIGSKGNDTGISHSVIQAKEELEKVREQVQNIE